MTSENNNRRYADSLIIKFLTWSAALLLGLVGSYIGFSLRDFSLKSELVDKRVTVLETQFVELHQELTGINGKLDTLLINQTRR